jgi:hypothetical protein
MQVPESKSFSERGLITCAVETSRKVRDDLAGHNVAAVAELLR